MALELYLSLAISCCEFFLLPVLCEVKKLLHHSPLLPQCSLQVHRLKNQNKSFLHNLFLSGILIKAMAKTGYHRKLVPFRTAS
jgi:hypothetical protein